MGDKLFCLSMIMIIVDSPRKEKTLEMRPIGCPETSVKDHHSTLRNARQHRG